jgi:hypothetical protein
MSKTDRRKSTYPVERPSRRDISLYGTRPVRQAVRLATRKIVVDMDLADLVDVPTDQHRRGVLWYWM